MFIQINPEIIQSLNENYKISNHPKMDLSYQECYQKFAQSYGQFSKWPLPYIYMNWFSTLQPQYQAYYLHPNNYCYLYDWTGQIIRAQEEQKTKKLSRGQKRKLKKKQLEEEYNKEKALIGKWVDKERKDLVVGLKKIEEQEKKMKEKKEKKLSHLIEIHKEVYKHHMKKKNPQQNPNKRVQSKKSKKRLSVIKKIKQIFQSRRQQSMKRVTNNQPTLQQQQKQLNSCNQNQQPINNHKAIEQQQYEDISDQQQQLSPSPVQEKEKKLPTVSFPIKQISYTNIGKLAGKKHNDITLRQWVTNVPTQLLQEISLRLINRLAYKQAIKKVNNPQKAKKLIVSGLKQCKRTLTTILQNKKSKCLIVALNIQRNNLVKGVDDQIQKCISLGQELKIPVIHVSTRAKLGRAFTGKFGPRLSIVSIVNWEGYQDYVDDLMDKWRQSCQEYSRLA